MNDNENETSQQYHDLYSFETIDATELLTNNQDQQPDQTLDQQPDQTLELEEFKIEHTKELEKEEPFMIDENLIENNCYEIYLESKRRAKITRNLAISSYLETKKIKNLDILHNIEDSESDLDDFSDSETE